MKEPIHFARIHYFIETDNVITHEFVLNLIKTNSDNKSKSDNYAKIVKITNEENKQMIDAQSLCEYQVQKLVVSFESMHQYSC